jgi:hypothetical protein
LTARASTSPARSRRRERASCSEGRVITMADANHRRNGLYRSLQKNAGRCALIDPGRTPRCCSPGCARVEQGQKRSGHALREEASPGNTGFPRVHPPARPRWKPQAPLAYAVRTRPACPEITRR